MNHLINQDVEATTPHKLTTGIKTSVSNLRVRFCHCVVQKVTAHVEGKALNTCHK